MRFKFEIGDSVRQFSRWTRNFATAMSDKEAELAVRAMTLEVLGRTIERSPVRKGRARASWTPYMTKYARGFTMPGGDPIAVSKGVEEGVYAEDFSGPVKLVTIGSNVPYILPLEYGHSGQAPRGMLRISQIEVQMGQMMTKELRKAIYAALDKANSQVLTQMRGLMIMGAMKYRGRYAAGLGR